MQKKMFIEKGYSSVSMKEISEACKIGRSSLYHYFASVEDIYNKVVTEEKEEKEPQTETVENFLSALKNELLKVDKNLHRAVVEHLLADTDNNCI